MSGDGGVRRKSAAVELAQAGIRSYERDNRSNNTDEYARAGPAHGQGRACATPRNQDRRSADKLAMMGACVWCLSTRC